MWLLIVFLVPFGVIAYFFFFGQKQKTGRKCRKYFEINKMEVAMKRNIFLFHFLF